MKTLRKSDTTQLPMQQTLTQRLQDLMLNHKQNPRARSSEESDGSIIRRDLSIPFAWDFSMHRVFSTQEDAEAFYPLARAAQGIYVCN
jgi:hypothetical protein